MYLFSAVCKFCRCNYFLKITFVAQMERKLEILLDGLVIGDSEELQVNLILVFSAEYYNMNWTKNEKIMKKWIIKTICNFTLNSWHHHSIILHCYNYHTNLSCRFTLHSYAVSCPPWACRITVSSVSAASSVWNR